MNTTNWTPWIIWWSHIFILLVCQWWSVYSRHIVYVKTDNMPGGTKGTAPVRKGQKRGQKDGSEEPKKVLPDVKANANPRGDNKITNRVPEDDHVSASNRVQEDDHVSAPIVSDSTSKGQSRSSIVTESSLISTGGASRNSKSSLDIKQPTSSIVTESSLVTIGGASRNVKGYLEKRQSTSSIATDSSLISTGGSSRNVKGSLEKRQSTSSIATDSSLMSTKSASKHSTFPIISMAAALAVSTKDESSSSCDRPDDQTARFGRKGWDIASDSLISSKDPTKAPTMADAILAAKRAAHVPGGGLSNSLQKMEGIPVQVFPGAQQGLVRNDEKPAPRLRTLLSGQVTGNQKPKPNEKNPQQHMNHTWYMITHVTIKVTPKLKDTNVTQNAWIVLSEPEYNSQINSST